jgi:hypothetical protein
MNTTAVCSNLQVIEIIMVVCFITDSVVVTMVTAFQGSSNVAAIQQLLASSMISLEIKANLEVCHGVAPKGVLSISYFIKIHPAIVVMQHSDRQTRMVSCVCVRACVRACVHICRDNATRVAMATWTDSLLHISR